MFDTIYVPIKVLKDLNDPKVNSYLENAKSEEPSFQTKDLDSVLDDYFLKPEPDGSLRLYKEKITYGEWEKDASNFFGGFLPIKSRELEPQNLTATINGFDFQQNPTLDISLDLKLVFVQGILTECSVADFSTRDAASRIQSMNKLKEEIRAVHIYRATLRGKLASWLSKRLFKLAISLNNLSSRVQKLATKL